jgi:competence protein ComEC
MEPSAVATDGGTDTGTDGGTDDSTPRQLSIADIHPDATGDDWENLNDEYVVFENTGEEVLDLSGWTVQDESGATYTFPTNTTLDAGATLTLRTGSGTATATERYWNADRPIWNNDGDTVIVTNADGQEVLTERYP